MPAFFSVFRVLVGVVLLVAAAAQHRDPPDRRLDAIDRYRMVPRPLQPACLAVLTGAEILLVGPTAGMLPDALFSRGITMLGGISVTKPDELLNIISEGGSGYHFFGKSAERTLIRKRQRSR